MYKRIPVKKLTGSETFKNVGEKKFSVLEFWQYGFSNLNSNVLRGALAEFIVENALKENIKEIIRNPWGDSDVITDDGKKIEVKCCSYIQDWDQNDYSNISWNGLKAKQLYYASADRDAVNPNLRERPTDYKSDIYILALFKHKDHTSLDILDMDQWCFYVLSRERIKEITKNANSISLVKLEKAKVDPVCFGDLAKSILKS